MAQLPDSLRLTESQSDELNRIREAAKRRHARDRKAASKRGRKYFPDLPYECSWAYEQEFMQRVQARDSVQSNI